MIIITSPFIPWQHKTFRAWNDWAHLQMCPRQTAIKVSSLAVCSTAHPVQNSGHHAEGSVAFRSAVHRGTPTAPSDDAVSAVHRCSSSLCRGHAQRQPSERSAWRLRTSGTHYRMTFATTARCQASVPNWKHFLLLHSRKDMPPYRLLVSIMTPYKSLFHITLIITITITITITTRNMGQSPTWGRPAPQVRLEIQFTGLVGRVKILGASPPRGRNIVSRKKSSWVGQHARL